MNKVFGVICFVLALAAVFGGLMNIGVRTAAGLEPEAGAILAAIVMASLFTWAGVALWRRKAG